MHTIGRAAALMSTDTLPVSGKLILMMHCQSEQHEVTSYSPS